jgi:hypothetical protein
VRQLDGIDSELSASDYLQLLREFPPPPRGDRRVEQPYAYLKKRVQSLRLHITAFRIVRGRKP